MAKKVIRVGFERDGKASRLAQAAALTLAILRYLGVASLAELEEALRRGEERVTTKIRCLVLDADDEALLADEEFAPILWLLQLGSESKTAPRPGVLLAICPECGAWSLAATSSPATCFLTDSCPGRAKAVVAAKRAPDPEGRTLDEILAAGEDERAAGRNPHTDRP